MSLDLNDQFESQGNIFAHNLTGDRPHDALHARPTLSMSP